MMRILSQLLALNFVLLSMFSFGQSKSSKKEKLSEYKNTITDYVPEDLNQYEILFVNLDSAEVMKRIKKAHYLSFIRHGLDTLSQPRAFLPSEAEDLKGLRKDAENFLSTKDIRKLQKKVRLKVVKSNQLHGFDSNTYRYLLDIAFTSSKASPTSQGFVIAVVLFFVDRSTGKAFKKIEDSKISVVDLVE